MLTTNMFCAYTRMPPHFPSKICRRLNSSSFRINNLAKKFADYKGGLSSRTHLAKLITVTSGDNSNVRCLSTSFDNKKSWIEIVELANQKLIQHQLTVRKSTLPLSSKLTMQGYFLLEICSNGFTKKKEPIDIFKASFSLSQSQIVENLVRKVEQHLQARKEPGILISPLGRKIDVKEVSSLTMDENGSMFFNNRKIRLSFPSCSLQENDKTFFSSCTIIRAIKTNDGQIEFFDDADADPDVGSPIATLDTKEAILSLSYPSDERRAFFKRILVNKFP